MDLDTSGVYGYISYLATVFFFLGSAVLVFVYCWYKGDIGMKESVKYQIFLEDEQGNDR